MNRPWDHAARLVLCSVHHRRLQKAKTPHFFGESPEALGTTMGFGEVRQPADYFEYRLELLRAMETFALGLAQE